MPDTTNRERPSTKREHLRALCRRHGFTFDTYSPGDGVTRYRFGSIGGALDQGGYFASNGDYTALGWREATAYVFGRIDGLASVPGARTMQARHPIDRAAAQRGFTE